VDVAVIGLGLIGGSVLRALAASGHRVLGFDADPATRATARTAAARAPVGARWQITVLDEVAGAGYSGLVTDVTSVKGPVRDLVEQRLHSGDNRLASFVGGHPMAGREVSGFTAGDPDLFAGCAWVLCLEPDRTVLPDWLELAALVTGLGARAVPATAAEHDRAVAAVSHVPHLLASVLAHAVAGDPLAAVLAAGSFRDGSRVAASRPELVAAMCGGNAAAVAPALDAALDALEAMRVVLDGPEPVTALRPLLVPGNAARRAWPPTAGAPVELPARVETLLELGRAGGWVSAVAADRRSVTAIRPA
jgi:prephenate dehydrogenase